MSSQVIAHLRDLSDPGAREFVVFEGCMPVRIFLVCKGGQVFGYRNRCPHAGAPLNRSPEGFLDEGNKMIQCRSHGAKFRIETGECIEGICRGDSLQALAIAVHDGVVTYTP